MTRKKEEILIVDDSLPIRISMSLVLGEMGYRVRTAEDGFVALREVSQGMPDILLSDLNMPGMSGFELLLVFHRRFPQIRTIAMSGDFSYGEAPSGVVADAFFQKGQGIEALIDVLAKLAHSERRASHGSNGGPLPIADCGAQGCSEGAYLTIRCPECHTAFTQMVEDDVGGAMETRCIHCGSGIEYSMFQNPSKTEPQTATVFCQ
jgi:predicted Zn finger-like uncharacterized protein